MTQEITRALTLDAIDDTVTAELSDDPYLTFKIASPKWGDPAGLRIGRVFLSAADPKDGLIDIGLDLDTGRFVDATVVQTPAERRDAPDLSELRAETGMPRFRALPLDRDEIVPTRRFQTPLGLSQDGGTRLFHLGPDIAPDRVLKSGPALFLFASGDLVAFGA